MALKQVKLTDITVSERFRKDLGNIEDLMASIEEKGILQPVTVDQDLNLLAGGRRYEAARRLGLEKIPVLVRKTEDELDAREVELLENVMRKDMTWSERALLVKRIATLYKEKTGTDYGKRTAIAKMLDKSKGWITRQLQLADALEAIPELAEEKTEDDAFKQLQRAAEDIEVEQRREQHREQIASKFGIDLSDLSGIDPEQFLNDSASGEHERTAIDWLAIAEANYYVCDVFEGLKSLEPGSFQLLEVDPPYGIDLATVRQERNEHELDRYNEVSSDEYPEFLSKLCQLCYRAAAENSWMIFWFGPTWHCQVREAILAAGFKLDDIPGIWAKPSGQTNRPDLYLARSYEPFLIARKGSPTIVKKGRSNIFSYPVVPPSERYHSTQRPIDLMVDILETFGYPGTQVLIPFLGSGVTLRACYKLDMMGIGCDLDQRNKDRFMLQIEKDISEGLYNE